MQTTHSTEKTKAEDFICRICGHAADRPYRLIMNGKVFSGCISAFHTGHIAENTASHAWHFRNVAVAWREKSRFDFQPTTGNWSR